VIVLAGNKVDLAAEHRAVQTEDARTFAEENGLIFAECSAKNGHAVNEMFSMIAIKMIGRQSSPQGPARAVRLNSELEQDSGSSGCRC
jgi:Ras-related protein Rab-5C